MHVLITGTSKGIGLAIAKRFAAQSGVSLSVCSRNEADQPAIQEALRNVSPAVELFASSCNVSIESEAAGFVKAAEQAFGSVDVLINNAGYGRFGPIFEMRSEEFDGQIATNLRGVFMVTQAVLPGMKSNKSGTIVTIGSLAGKNGFVSGAAYCASKFGVRGLMQSLFLDVREFGIRVVTVSPGSVDTSFFVAGAAADGLKSKNALKAEDIADAVYSAALLPQNATMSEIDIRPTNPTG